MVLYELATNAVKYGALSNSRGRVSVTWDLTKDEQSSRATLHWQETGGPPVAPPKERGFGSLLIENALDGDSGKAELEFHPEGVVCNIQVAL
jgi:two-component sensor histidine kinase